MIATTINNSNNEKPWFLVMTLTPHFSAGHAASSVLSDCDCVQQATGHTQLPRTTRLSSPRFSKNHKLRHAKCKITAFSRLHVCTVAKCCWGWYTHQVN